MGRLPAINRDQLSVETGGPGPNRHGRDGPTRRFKAHVQLSNSTTFGSQFFRPPQTSLALAKALSLI